MGGGKDWGYIARSGRMGGERDGEVYQYGGAGGYAGLLDLFWASKRRQNPLNVWSGGHDGLALEYANLDRGAICNTKHREKMIKGRMKQHSSQQQDDDANTDGYSVAETDSPRRKAAQAYEALSKTTDTSFYDALKAGDNGFGRDSSSCKAAQTYEELSMKTDTSVYDALKKGENG
ncbi:uncharacterized protein LOC128235919 [Mya arenaria]|uniref:uncharacterized protein LOC128235919 n=1 Tax=Mya arenaria TaxID=6604 RepID=UPI0022E4E901|nr:uncharacterized protein LOC128235919 [Mya arenaria]